MKYARFALLALGIALFAKTEPVRADYYWCDMLCGPSASCDTQCVDGGTNITCGAYNGGAGNGMCYDTQCYPSWVGPYFGQHLGQHEYWWWHEPPGHFPHIDCKMLVNASVYYYDERECTSSPLYDCILYEYDTIVYHDVYIGYCDDLYGVDGTLACPY